MRAFLESVNLVTSASLDRAKLAGTPAKAGCGRAVQELCIFLFPKPRG